MPASLSSPTCREYLSRIQDYFRETGFRAWPASFLSKSVVAMGYSLLVGRPMTARVSCDNHPSVMSLTVVVIFRVSAVHVVSVACQGGWTPLTRQRTSCGNEKGRAGPRGLNQTSLNFPRKSLRSTIFRRLKRMHDSSDSIIEHTAWKR